MKRDGSGVLAAGPVPHHPFFCIAWASSGPWGPHPTLKSGTPRRHREPLERCYVTLWIRITLCVCVCVCVYKWNFSPLCTPQINCVCLCAQSLSHAWLFATPWTVARQAPPFMGFPRQEYWSRWPFFSSRGSSRPKDRTLVSYIGKSILHHWAIWEAQKVQ